MKQIILLASIVCSSLAYSQKVATTLPEMRWQVHHVPANVSFANDFSSAYSFQKGIVYVSKSEAVAPVHYGKGDGYGLIKINENGEVAWNTPVPGYVLGVSKFKGNILVVYTPDWNEKRRGWAVIGHAGIALFDAKSGQKLKEALIYDTKSTFTEITMVKKPSDEFSCILVRTSPYNGRNSINKEELIATTLKLSALELGDDLNVVRETAIKMADDAAYVGSVANENGELFIATFADRKIRIEQFSPSFVSLKKLESSVNFKSTPPRTLVFTVDDHNSQSVLLAMYFRNPEAKDMTTELRNFQFGIGKVSSAAEILTKDFARSITQLNNEKGKSIDPKTIDAMIPVGVVTLKDKIIVIKEVRGTYSLGGNSSSTRYFNGDLLLSFYDKEGKLLKHIGLNKEYELFMNVTRSIGYKLIDNKLYIVTNGLPGGFRLTSMLCAINIDQMTMESLSQFEKVQFRGELELEAGASFWFNNILLIHDIPTGERTTLRKVEL